MLALLVSQRAVKAALGHDWLRAGAAQPGSVSQSTESLQSLLELRMLRVFREVQDSDTKRILIELAEQIVKRQGTPPQAG